MKPPYFIENGYPRTAYKDFSHITLNFPRRWTLPLLKVKREFIGLDTETVDGKIRVIADSRGDYLNVYDNEIAIYKLMNFITDKSYRGKWLALFNINYDFDALIKYLPDDNKTELYERNKTDFEGNIIKYLPKKSLQILRGKNSVWWFDISQFYKTSLDKAVEKYLHPSKEELEIMRRLKEDRANLFQKYSLDDITAYCIRDAVYTKRLADLFQNKFIETFHINMSKPFSPASLAQTYVKIKCEIPTIREMPSDLLETAYRAYYGGRMEIMKRGAFKSAYKYDINSAYPTIMKDLLNIENGEWRKVWSLHEDAEYGFYKVKVNIGLDFRELF